MSEAVTPIVVSPLAAGQEVWPVELVRPAPLRLARRTFDAAHPGVMAILNRTPDSFYAPARYVGEGRAEAALERMVAEGADIIDVGGVRAGSVGPKVSAEEEIERVAPFLRYARSAFPDLVISLDTWRSEVARAAADAGIDLINDTWQGADPALARVAAEIGAGYVVSHSGGLPPRTDPVGVTYGPDPDDVVRDVIARLKEGAEKAVDAGVAPDAVLLDPTLDFGKTTRHSLRLVRATAQIASLGYPVMQAISRKDFVGETLDLSADERLEGTLAATAVSAWLGAIVFRAHDVRATRRALDMTASIRGDRPPAVSVRGVPVE